MRLLVVAASVFLATSCTRADTSGDAAGTDTGSIAAGGHTTGAAATASGRAPALADTIRIEGTPEPMTLQLVESPDGFPMKFSTYMPPDMQVSFVPDSAAVKFTAAFGGTVQPLAYVHVQRLAGGIEDARAESIPARMLGGKAVDRLEVYAGKPPWADDGAGYSYTENGTHYSGTIATQTEGGTPFRIIIHMPSEYGDGMGPRVEMLLRHWRWSDGSPLIP